MSYTLDELREAAQAWADGKSVMFDSDVRLVEAVNAALAAFDSLAAQLEEAQERERQLREALEQIEQLDRMGHNSEVAAEMGYIARVTLDSTQTHGGSDDACS